jgi:hypothetical protein
VDSQSAKTSGVGGEARGYDGAKKVRGRKRQLLVDTEGFVLKARTEEIELTCTMTGFRRRFLVHHIGEGLFRSIELEPR